MLESTGMTPRWGWLTICAILLITALPLGYKLFDMRDRLSTMHGELAIAREHVSQTSAKMVKLRNAATKLKSQISELRKQANLTNAQMVELRNVITKLKSELVKAKKLQGNLHEAHAQAVQLNEALKTANTKLLEKQRRIDTLENELEHAKNAEVWKLLSERTVALDKATAYRQALEKDLANAKLEIEGLKIELDEATAAASN